jgi:hypothetical protein
VSPEQRQAVAAAHGAGPTHLESRRDT